MASNEELADLINTYTDEVSVALTNIKNDIIVIKGQVGSNPAVAQKLQTAADKLSAIAAAAKTLDAENPETIPPDGGTGGPVTPPSP